MVAVAGLSSSHTETVPSAQTETIRGLTAAAVQVRLKGEGYNELPRLDKRTPLRIIVEVIREPMLLLLLGAGALCCLRPGCGNFCLSVARRHARSGSAVTHVLRLGDDRHRPDSCEPIFQRVSAHGFSSSESVSEMDSRGSRRHVGRDAALAVRQPPFPLRTSAPGRSGAGARSRIACGRYP